MTGHSSKIQVVVVKHDRLRLRVEIGYGNAHLHIFETVLLADDSKHVFLAAFLHLASQYKLVEYKVGLLEIEDDVELAHIAVVLVHLFDVSMHNFESDQLVVGGSAASDEEQGGISSVDHLCVWIVVKVSASGAG